MTSEEIRVAIARLHVLTEANVITALTGDYGWTDKKVREYLVELLEQADPDAHIELPRDADGVPIRIGDELCGYGRPDGGVYCMATNGAMVYVGEIDEFAPKEWMTWRADQCRHYHKPAIEDILDELIGRVYKQACEDVHSNQYSTVHADFTAEYAAKLREVMNND